MPTGGQAWGCLSETLLLGFDGQDTSFSLGPITPEQVEQTLQMARLYGFELGDFNLNESSYPVPTQPREGDANPGRSPV